MTSRDNRTESGEPRVSLGRLEDDNQTHPWTLNIIATSLPKKYTVKLEIFAGEKFSRISRRPEKRENK